VDPDGRLQVERAADGAGDGEAPADAWWRVVAVAAWRHLDATGRVADVSGLTVPGSVEAQD
jgi:hypothetical protein